MDRRKFLRVVTQASIAALWVNGAPGLSFEGLNGPQVGSVVAKISGNWYRGARKGVLQTSPDAGKSWKPAFNFGEACAIQRIFERNGKITLQIGVKGYSFLVESPDGLTWWTVGQAPVRA